MRAWTAGRGIGVLGTRRCRIYSFPVSGLTHSFLSLSRTAFPISKERRKEREWAERRSSKAEKWCRDPAEKARRIDDAKGSMRGKNFAERGKRISKHGRRGLDPFGQRSGGKTSKETRRGRTRERGAEGRILSQTHRMARRTYEWSWVFQGGSFLRSLLCYSFSAGGFFDVIMIHSCWKKTPKGKRLAPGCVLSEDCNGHWELCVQSP